MSILLYNFCFYSGVHCSATKWKIGFEPTQNLYSICFPSRRLGPLGTLPLSSGTLDIYQ